MEESKIKNKRGSDYHTWLTKQNKKRIKRQYKIANYEHCHKDQKQWVMITPSTFKNTVGSHSEWPTCNVTTRELSQLTWYMN